jgi:hypothetical protein
MISLKAAREGGRMDEFLSEREAEAQGDQAAFNATLKSMAGTSKEAPAASKRRSRAG